MWGRGISFHGPVNLGEAGEGHRSKPKVVLAYDSGCPRSVLGDFILFHILHCCTTDRIYFNQDNINILFFIDCNGFMIPLTSITMYIHLCIDI